MSIKDTEAFADLHTFVGELADGAWTMTDDIEEVLKGHHQQANISDGLEVILEEEPKKCVIPILFMNSAFIPFNDISKC